jgi:hypothetical protein
MQAKNLTIEQVKSKIFPNDVFGFSVLYELTGDLYANLRFVTERLYSQKSLNPIDLLNDDEKYLFDIIHLSADAFVHQYFEKGLFLAPNGIILCCFVILKCGKRIGFHTKLRDKKIRVVFWEYDGKIHFEPIKTHLRLIKKIFSYYLPKVVAT